ncbi:allantoicase [Streptomyces buecherae]|uniref:Probable allantoicase n=1 Tax=Streptomyces buecherae TaxID=2763006 RepID=A0A7H8N656_9ACTN|nr:allantoicase [Streptomyces buecherae]QKW49891.1 allantoicase [Streptomyces buecherae]
MPASSDARPDPTSATPAAPTAPPPPPPGTGPETAAGPDTKTAAGPDTDTKTDSDSDSDARPYRGGDPYADYRGGEFPFTALVDLADRRLGGGVIAANDEFFAERENLLLPGPAVFDPREFGHKGKVMDGWETRRRRGADADHPFPADGDHDWALIRLGVPGVVHGVIVDTAHFRGNYPRRVSVEAAAVPGAPSARDLLSDAVRWEPLVPPTPVRGHAANGFAVDAERRFTHLRLCQYPDGGIARLRVHGTVVPDPEWLGLLGTFDLASVVHGGAVEDASDRFYSPPTNIIRPDLARQMDDGWETRRRRERGGHDWVRFRLAGHGEIRALEIDTAYLKGNAAGWAAVYGCDATAADPADAASWYEILPRTALRPDSPHRFRLAAPATATHLRLDVFPDGGIARLRAHGALTASGQARLVERYAALTD